MKTRLPFVATLMLGVLLGASGTGLAGLWNKAERDHADQVEKDRRARVTVNEAALKLTKDPDRRKPIEAKLASFSRSLELMERYRAAIDADDLVTAKRLREALHLLRLQGESYTAAVEIYAAATGYKLARPEVKAALVPVLEETARSLENAGQAYDAGIAALTK